MTLHEFTDNTLFLSALVQRFHQLDPKSVALAGGSTPKAFYQVLNKSISDWNQTLWFVGDERWVPAQDSLSNEAMVLQTLGANHPEFHKHFLSWRLNEDPVEAATLFEKRLINFLGHPPTIDLVLLGLGEDGHTLSLFPETKALTEQGRFAVVNEVPQQSESSKRVTLTYPTVNAAKEIWFLVQGSAKASMVQRLLDGDATIPASAIQNRHQHLFWLQ
jgi:6-phosphogluconolactonase